MATIGAVILAAGESLRFGQPKQLVEFRGRTLIERIVTAANEAGCKPIIVVTGSDSAKVAAAIANESVSIVDNEKWHNGMGSSIRVGLQRLIELAPETDAVVLLVCDQPFVTGGIIAKLNERWATTGKTIVASSYSNTLGVPALFDRACFTELLEIDEEQGAKPIILRNPDRLAELAFPEGANDIDTISDYEAAQSAAASQPLK